jgi:hypothetical protein
MSVVLTVDGFCICVDTLEGDVSVKRLNVGAYQRYAAYYVSLPLSWSTAARLSLFDLSQKSSGTPSQKLDSRSNSSSSVLEAGAKDF